MVPNFVKTYLIFKAFGTDCFACKSKPRVLEIVLYQPLYVRCIDFECHEHSLKLISWEFFFVDNTNNNIALSEIKAGMQHLMSRRKEDVKFSICITYANT